METTVSPEYRDVLDHLSESLRADRRLRFVALLDQMPVEDFIPQPRTEMSAPQLRAEIV